MKLRSQLLPDSEVLASKVPADVSLSAVTDNSSRVTPGAAFFAVRGTRSDGHAFLEAASQGGAAALVVEDRAAYDAHPRAILVASTRQALALAASRWHGEPTRAFDLVGVTGTNGKTTSTYLLKNVWEAMGFAAGLVGTVECQFGSVREPNRLTTPDALTLQSWFARMREADVSHAAIEVTSIALDQHRVGGSLFDVALFTNLTQDHLDYHQDFESYYQAKRRLFVDYPLKAAVINSDDPWGKRLLSELPPALARFSFALDDRGAAFHVREARFEKTGTLATVETPAGTVELRVPHIGRHNLYNALGVLASAHALGQELPAVVRALGVAGGAPGRLERVMEGASRPNIFVDYAHTDDALLNVLRTLSELKAEGRGRILTVFGCGGDRDRTKRPRMAQAAARYSDVVIATSDNPRTEDPERILDDIEQGLDRGVIRYHRDVSRRAAIHWALAEARPEDIVLVAGKGHETYQIIGREQFPFDDREVIRDYYRNV